MAGRITIAEVEELVEPGELDPEHVHTPGVFVQRVVEVGEARQADREADATAAAAGAGRKAERRWH